MKGWFWILCTVLLSSCCANELFACGFYEGYYGYYKFFEPEKRHLSQFQGFLHYDPEDYVFGQSNDWFEMPQVSPVEDQQLANLKSWKYYLGAEFPETDIWKAIYGSSKEWAAIVASIPPDSRPSKNMLARAWQQNRRMDEFRYIQYARDCEPHCWKEIEWGPWPGTSDDQIIEMVERGKKGYAATKIPFIKLRYAYQIIRLAQYHDMPDKAISYYHRYAKPVLWASKELGAWTTGNYAGCLREKRRYAESAYAFSRVYANAPSRRIQARWGWKIRTEKQWDQVMALCQNDREKADNHALRALSDHSVPYADMWMMQRLDPGREDLDMIIVREINELEIEMLGPIYYGSDAFEYRLRDRRILPKVRKRIESLDSLLVSGIASRQANNLAMWQTAHAYLLFLNGKFEQARTKMNRLRQSLRGEDLLRAQRMHLEMQLVTADKITPAMENEYATSAIAQQGWNEDMKTRFRHFRDDALFWKYLDQGDHAKAIMIRDPGVLLDRYGVRTSLIDSLIAFIDKPYKNGLELEMEHNLIHGAENGYHSWNGEGGCSKEALIEMKGATLIAQGKLEEAIRTLEILPKGYLARVEADPFRPRIQRADKDGGLWQNRTYDKLSFARTLKALIDQTQRQDGKNHLRHLIIGNAYLNTLSGQRAGAIKGSPGHSGWHYGYEVVFLAPYNIRGHKGMLWPRSLDAEPAIAYYELAISETDDPEFQALAYYMIAKCQRVQNIWITAIEGENARQKALKRSPRNGLWGDNWEAYYEATEKYRALENDLPAFEILRSQYAGTEVVDMLIHECADFGKYCGN